MKKIIVSTLSVALLSGSAVWAADQVQLNDTPLAVQKTIGMQRPDAKVQSIEKETKDGREVFKVEFQNSSGNPTLWVANDGSVIKEKEGGLLGVFHSRSLAIADLPAPAQATVKTETGNDQISSIDGKAKDGKTAYQVKFKQSGKSEKILVAEDGTIMEDSRSGRNIHESAGSRRLTMPELPKPVQDTITKQSQDANLPLKGIKIHSESKSGEPVYRVEFQEKGSNTKLWIKEDGSIMKQEK